MRTLYGLLQSPWTEKARWSLDHHSIAYRYHEHVPVLGEVLLRIKARSRPKGTKPSVPLLVDGDDVLCSSLAIARHADARGSAESLFPPSADAEVMRWADVSDRIIEGGRARVLQGLRTSRTAQREALPPFIPGPLRGAFTPMAVTAAAFLASKHRVAPDVEAQAQQSMRPSLDEVRAALGKRTSLLARDGLSFADIAIAASLQALRPPARAPIGPATREIWTNEALASEYPDLLAWRDALYAKHRRD